MKIKEVRHLLTYDCNLRCKHCYLSAGDVKNIKNSQISQEILNNFYSYFKPQIVSATGGEPLLFKDSVIKIAKASALYGGSMELVTNGFFLARDLINQLQVINPKVFYQISLDGTEDYHNYLRCNMSAFKIALNAIDIASASGALTKVRLTATSENFNQIDEVIKILDKYNRKNIKLVIRPVLFSGRAVENDLEINIDFNEFEKFKDQSRVIDIETIDNMGKCGCGVDTIAVDPVGDIYPCTYFVFDKKYKMGNITDVLGDIKEAEKFVKFTGACYARR